ncbi:hypothetical protein MXD63_21180 [Frankia sp. Cpl3]|nr:hypothetical protein [Frankia sp. Cpl3]
MISIGQSKIIVWQWCGSEQYVFVADGYEQGCRDLREHVGLTARFQAAINLSCAAEKGSSTC